MKPTLLSLLTIAILSSCSTSGEKSYVGTWVNKEHQATIRIKKDGDHFVMETIRGNKVVSSENYIMKDGRLKGSQPLLDSLTNTEYISYTSSTGRLSMQGIEWEKSEH